MQSEFPGVRRVVGALAFLFLGACSGGSDSNSGRHLSLSTTALTFNANAPSAAPPASQVITASFGEGVTNVAALHTGPAVERVEVAINGATAQITVVPAAPSTVGAGEYKATIAITGYFCGDPTCSRLDAGETQTATVSYQVSPIVNDVAPKAAIAGTSANVVIRGAGFNGFAVQGVNFGSTPATSFTVASDSEIRAVYPALTAGNYPVTIDVSAHTGTITTNATLVVVDPITHTAQALAWPGAVGTVHSLEYDAARNALLVATDTGGGQLVRFAYTNAWQTPTTATLADVRDAALSIDLGQWAAVTSSGVTPVDPVTLQLGTIAPAPSLPTNSFLKSIAMLNTNVAIVTTGIADSTVTALYAYTARTTGLIKLESTGLNNGTARGSANGDFIVLMQGDPSLTTAPNVLAANAAGSIAASGVTLNQNGIPSALDRDASRVVLNGTRVFDGSLTLLGTLPIATAAVAVSPDGKLAYTYETGDNSIRVFNIAETNSGAEYGASSPVALVASPGAGVKMTISPDGNTLFIAGTTQLVVQPTPAL